MKTNLFLNQNHMIFTTLINADIAHSIFHFEQKLNFKMWLILILASLVLILILWYILSYLGIFNPINIRIEKPNFLQEPIYIAYKCFTGSYTEAYKSFSYIDSICPFEPNRVLSIYYDDPHKVAN